VRRPPGYDSERLFGTPDWRASGKDLYNVRDLHLVVGDTVILCPSPARCRYFEADGLRGLWAGALDAGARWIAAPRPRLAGSYRTPTYRAGGETLSEEDARHRALTGGRIETYHRLAEEEVLFDAANVVRLGRDLIYLVSNTGNRRGARWLQGLLGERYRVHVTSAYRSSHLDSTILPLREGLVLLNGVRVGPDAVPEVLESWDKIFFSDVAPVPPEELDFQRNVRERAHRELSALGVDSDLDHMSSPWTGLNVLSLDPRTVLVHDRQAPLIKELERRGLTVIPVRMRHCYTMLGGLHCCTLDTARDGAVASALG
jgi:glycine amidinotransferase/scyllo-inosamine-4-phosphate amidinotransferase 1